MIDSDMLRASPCIVHILPAHPGMRSSCVLAHTVMAVLCSVRSSTVPVTLFVYALFVSTPTRPNKFEFHRGGDARASLPQRRIH